MIWVIAYLISIIFVAFTAGLMAVSNDEQVEIESYKDVLLITSVCVGWPVVVLAIPFMAIYYARRDHWKDRVKGLKSTFVTEDLHAAMVAANEADLKAALKLARQGEVEFEPKQLEMIREELLSRNMERNLTK
jgi:uncharacterized membrane protein